MKQIMASESSSDDHGIASFGFNPLDKERIAASEHAPTLFEMTDPVEDLAQALLREYAGRTMSVREVFEQHQIGKRYTLKNYQDAIRKLETEKRVQADPPADRRVRGGRITVGHGVRITFPPKEDRRNGN